MFGLSRYVVHRTLRQNEWHPYHYQQVQQLLARDEEQHMGTVSMPTGINCILMHETVSGRKKGYPFGYLSSWSLQCHSDSGSCVVPTSDWRSRISIREHPKHQVSHAKRPVHTDAGWNPLRSKDRRQKKWFDKTLCGSTFRSTAWTRQNDQTFLYQILDRSPIKASTSSGISCLRRVSPRVNRYAGWMVNTRALSPFSGTAMTFRT